LAVIRWMLFGVAVTLLGIWYSKRGKAKDIGSTSEVRVGDAPAGYVRLYGRARAIEGRLLRDPIEQRECLWFRIETSSFQSEEGESGIGQWVVIKTTASSREFDVWDDTGSCRVSPAGARVEIDDPPPATTMVDDLQYRIWRICEGDALFVVGKFKPLNADGATPSGPRGYVRAGDGRAYLISTYAPESTIANAGMRYLVSGLVAAALLLLTLA
jgi:hypothetical protein